MSKFTNSPLVVYTKLSPHHSGQRTKPIDMIAVHCMAGNCTIEGCGELFMVKEASSQYGIGSDGRIAMYVEEKNRSWCTSSAAVDQRAITIEVANTTSREPFPVSDKAYNSLVKLCVDICKRNNIKKLLWEADKSLFGNVARQNLVVHRWFAAKSCPGETLYELQYKLAKDVNAKLGVKTPTVEKQETNVIQGTPEKIIWKFFKHLCLNDFAIAGIMGNLYAESGLIANNLQNSAEKRLKMDDDEYTKKVDDGSYKRFTMDGARYGLAQWGTMVRKKDLLNYAKRSNKSVGDLDLQLNFIWMELNSKKYAPVMKMLKNAKSVPEASYAFLTQYIEGGVGATAATKSKRTQYGEDFYKKNAKNSNGITVALPYTIKVNSNVTLNIRKGPGTNYKECGKITDNAIYTIVKESRGVGAKKWGKLKSGAGWISLDYCIKVS